MKKIEKKKLYLGGVILLLLVGCFLLVFFISKGSFANTDSDNLSLVCPDSASPGDDITCTITLNATTIVAQGVIATFDTTEGLTFVSATTGEGWNGFFPVDETGFVLTNFNGVSGSSLVTTVVYKIPEDATSNQIYNFKLTNSSIGDGGDITIDFDDVSSDIRIKSNINTLDNVSLSSGDTVTYDNDKTYSASVNSDKVTVTASKTDANSTVSGDVGELNLHYGTNNFNIVVTSETGIDNTYNLNIFRPYELSVTNYTYSSEDNYLYTMTDRDSSIIISNLNLPSELNASIVDVANEVRDKLVIRYNEEVLLETKVIYIDTSDYTVNGKIIYFDKSANVEGFLFGLNQGDNNERMKIFDLSDVEANYGDTILDNYKLKYYYNNTLLDTYTLKEEYLKFNNLNIDNTNKIIKRIEVNTTYDAFIQNIETAGSINIKDKASGNSITGTSKIKTGDILEINLPSGKVTYQLSVIGDVNGDGLVNLGDVGVLYRHLKGKETLENYEIAAGDVINNGSIKINDVSRVYRYVKGKITNIGVEE